MVQALETSCLPMGLLELNQNKLKIMTQVPRSVFRAVVKFEKDFFLDRLDLCK
jgi:hypothetical protein